MDIPSAKSHIQKTLDDMAQPFGEPVFDEWFLVGRQQDGWKVLVYEGPRVDSYQAEFTKDMAALRNTLDPAKLQLGDFDFSYVGYGSAFDAHLCPGPQMLVLFNNTEKSTGDITGDPRWKMAQGAFSALLERFIVDPLTA